MANWGPGLCVTYLYMYNTYIHSLHMIHIEKVGSDSWWEKDCSILFYLEMTGGGGGKLSSRKNRER